MPTNQSKTAQPVKDYDLRPEWKIFIPTIIIILLISIPAVVAPKSTEEFFKALYNPLAFNFGTLYLWITVILICMCFYFALSRWGNIKFGRKDEKPEFSILSWSAMIFCSAVGGAIMFWAITEPLYDIMSPPQYAQPMSVDAYDWALAYLLMHWGPNAWCTYLITSPSPISSTSARNLSSASAPPASRLWESATPAVFSDAALMSFSFLASCSARP